jgi:hypothetical protein
LCGELKRNPVSQMGQAFGVFLQMGQSRLFCVPFVNS